MHKTITGVRRGSSPHWVGDGFPVRSIFSYQQDPASISPFLLLDYAAPHRFAAEPGARRGVGAHPHKGFETVTIVYQGELEHRDSSGGGGRIGPGQVQWMTAGSGIEHEEFHSPEFARTGGTLEMVQLWVNLRARDKQTPPGYQTLTEIPQVQLPDQAGQVGVIAGSFESGTGPACTRSRIQLWNLDLNPGARLELPFPAGDSASILVLRGELHGAGAGDLLMLSRAGDRFELQADGAVRALVLSGEPIDEPVVGSGPFVMNTRDEIAAAYEEYRRGQFRHVA